MSESIRTERLFIASPVAFGARPTAREWMRHALLFLATALTATFAGILLSITEAPEPALAAPTTWVDYIFYPFVYYFQFIGLILTGAAVHPALLAQGATFAASLLAILTAHEMGHYLACRFYGVDATLPYFIPAPPLFLAGTFGAFIKIKSPIPSRRALFDIGVAGPLAGFVVIIPVALAAVLTAHTAPPLPAEGTVLILNDPPLLRLLAAALGIDLSDIAPNPFYFAAWFGLIVTSLNLLPVGQLDGGHATYALFGGRIHTRLARLAFLLACILAVLGWTWHGAPGGFVYAVLLFIMLRLHHPPVMDATEPLGSSRTFVAALTLVVFLLSFLPFPITIR